MLKDLVHYTASIYMSRPAPEGTITFFMFNKEERLATQPLILEVTEATPEPPEILSIIEEKLQDKMPPFIVFASSMLGVIAHKDDPPPGPTPPDNAENITMFIGIHRPSRKMWMVRFNENSVITHDVGVEYTGVFPKHWMRGLH